VGALGGWLINRVTIAFAVIALIVVGWNAYVAAHDDGILAGVVTGRSGEPVPGAEVVLSERTLVSLAPIAKTTTDGQGRFRFEKHDRHALVLNASKPGVGGSGRIEIRLYFRNQNRALEDPVRLEPAG
jgi:hypothetical protein